MSSNLTASAISKESMMTERPVENKVPRDLENTEEEQKLIDEIVELTSEIYNLDYAK